MYVVRTPRFVKALAPYAIWHIPNDTNRIYLTFDDGPTPGITEEILSMLRTYRAKATFFCLGKNAAAHPTFVQQILREGHHVGHHSYNHIDGWKTPHFAYLKEVVAGGKILQTNLFRPPYGRITPAQAQSVCQRYKLVMWDIISGDFDVHLSPETCTQNVLRNTRSGSVIVFHDSVKAAPRMLKSLPEVLTELTNRGFQFAPIPYAD